MPNRGDRGGSRTRAHIAAVATRMFLARGFDEVTIAEVAAAAGVSKVTVFAYFDRKEDLLLDQLPDAVDIARQVIRDSGDAGANGDSGGTGGTEDVIAAIRRAALDLAERRHPLSGLQEGEDAFMRAFVNSPALISRLRAFEHEIETEVAAELHADAGFVGDSDLTAALLVAAYRTVAVETVRRRLAGADLDDLAASHRERLNSAFDAVAHGLPAGRPAASVT